MDDSLLREKYNPDGSPLRDLQLKLLTILQEFNAFCRERNLSYSLTFGTLLGAVRHKGFIPWDDDVDVMMTREQWNEFEKVIGENGRLTEKLYLRRRLKPEICIDGLGFIDLFIVDRCPNGKVKQWIKKTSIQIVQYLYRCQIHRSAWKAGQKTRFRPWFILFPIALLRTTDGWQSIWDNIMIWFTVNDGCDKEDKANVRMCCYTDNVRDIPTVYPLSVFEGFVELQFEGDMYLCIGGYDEFLKIVYGDYMQLPKHIHNHSRASS